MDYLWYLNTYRIVVSFGEYIMGYMNEEDDLFDWYGYYDYPCEICVFNGRCDVSELLSCSEY